MFSDSAEGQVWVADLHRGAFFGETALIFENHKRSATVRACTNCDLFMLSRDDFKMVLQEFPDSAVKVQLTIEAAVKMLNTVGNCAAGDSDSSISDAASAMILGRPKEQQLKSDASKRLLHTQTAASGSFGSSFISIGSNSSFKRGGDIQSMMAGSGPSESKGTPIEQYGNEPVSPSGSLVQLTQPASGSLVQLTQPNGGSMIRPKSNSSVRGIARKISTKVSSFNAFLDAGGSGGAPEGAQMVRLTSGVSPHGSTNGSLVDQGTLSTKLIAKLLDKIENIEERLDEKGVVRRNSRLPATSVDNVGSDDEAGVFGAPVAPIAQEWERQWDDQRGAYFFTNKSDGSKMYAADEEG